MDLKLLSGPELADQWGELRPQIEDSLAYGAGTVTSYGLFIQCLGAQAQCWVRDEGGVCITRFEENEGKRQLAIVVCTSPGWFAHGPEILEELEDFARHNGCKRTIVYGRKGWKRALDRYGYYEPYTTLIKEL